MGGRGREKVYDVHKREDGEREREGELLVGRRAPRETFKT